MKKIFLTFAVVSLFFSGLAFSGVNAVKDLVLVEANSICGEGLIYSVKQGKFKEREVEWLKTIIRF